WSVAWNFSQSYSYGRCSKGSASSEHVETDLNQRLTSDSTAARGFVVALSRSTRARPPPGGMLGSWPEARASSISRTISPKAASIAAPFSHGLRREDLETFWQHRGRPLRIRSRMVIGRV